MNASIETNVGLIRGAVPDTVDETAASDAHSALRAKIRKYTRLFSNEADCEHLELEFDEINDVYCKHCRKDFTA
jgi:hypothetical protein